MSRHRFATSAILAAVAALLIVGPTLAKEGAEANLDTVLPRDAQPGSTIDVGWSVMQIENDQSVPMSGSPVYIRLVGPDGTSATEVMGTEVPSGSGHYTASIQVPTGGIAEVLVGMRGESCTAASCGRADLIFPLIDDPLVTGAAPLAPSAAAPSAGASIGAQLAPLVAIGVAIAVAGGLAALVVGRRRMAEAPAGR